jgi:hypothetical protein
VALFRDDRPRPHHYAFAHRELRAIARRFAGGLPELARSGRMDAALAMTWDRVGDRLAEGDRLSREGLAASPSGGAAGSQVVLVTMPRPAHAAEAYFAAIVVAGGRLARYFVLEHGWTARDEPRTVLCEWGERGHVNLGDGPPPDAAAFLEALQEHVRSAPQ